MLLYHTQSHFPRLHIGLKNTVEYYSQSLCIRNSIFTIILKLIITASLPHIWCSGLKYGPKILPACRYFLFCSNFDLMPPHYTPLCTSRDDIRLALYASLRRVYAKMATKYDSVKSDGAIIPELAYSAHKPVLRMHGHKPQCRPCSSYAASGYRRAPFMKIKCHGFIHAIEISPPAIKFRATLPSSPAHHQHSRRARDFAVEPFSFNTE